MGTCMMLSSWSTTSIEDVAEASGSGLRWFQLYIFRDRELTKSLVQRAERAGYKAIVVTVDQQGVPKRDAFVPPPYVSFSHLGIHSTVVVDAVRNILDPSVTWEDIDWIRGLTTLPVLVKGILTAEDARLALNHKVSGIIVSNHGGRQLDGVPATVSHHEIVSIVYVCVCLWCID